MILHHPQWVLSLCLLKLRIIKIIKLTS
jgi:hypothetical protein